MTTVGPKNPFTNPIISSGPSSGTTTDGGGTTSWGGSRSPLRVGAAKDGWQF